MNDNLKQKFVDSILSVLPIMIIMLIIATILKFSVALVLSIIISTVLLLIGITFFTYGSELSMIEIGTELGSNLIKTKKPLLIFIISFIVGIIITIAEPDLKVLADQLSLKNPMIFIIIVSMGVGLFLSLATIRIIYEIDLKKIIIISYGLIILLTIFANKNMIPISFDAGGVTTGPMSVPFIMAMGLGFSKSMSRKDSKNNSFGLVALCSIGPILTTLIYSIFIKSEINYTNNTYSDINNLGSLISSYVNSIIPTLKDVFISLLPILILFIIFNLISKSIRKQRLKKVILGLVVSFIGIVIFIIGVTAGYMKLAYLIGANMADKPVLLIILGLIIGFVIIKAEPAVLVLTEQIERISLGSINKKVMTNALSIGVVIAILISILRIFINIDIIPILISGYIISIIFMFFTPKLFTMVSFDAGGAISGPMSSSFILPLILGICASKGNTYYDAFGCIALVALSPLITIQILGFIYNIKVKIDTQTNIDESIIEYNWGYYNG